LGDALHKSSLDKLPQLFNVIRGDMSFVGPEPIVASECVNHGDIVWEYFKTRPGLTGVSQLSPDQLLSCPERVTLDCRYVRNWSLRNDLLILIGSI
jgi:exopolysaccharide production protein ExoY